MPSKTQSIIVGGLVVGLLSTSVLNLINVLCCAGVIIGAMAGVWHYTTTYKLTISAGQGVLIGVLAGALGAVVSGVLNYVLTVAGLDVMNQMLLNFVESANLPSSQVEMIQEQAEAATSVGTVLFGMVTNALLFAVFGAIGGAIGASVFKSGGDAPGGGPTGGGSGGPRSPVGSGGPRPGGSRQPAPSQPTGGGTTSSDPSTPSYRPPREKEPAPQA